MEIAKVLEMQKATKTKLVSAIALLLVAALMMSMSTYAWFVLATKPEVKEIKTTAGANGYLEIALAGTTTENELTVIAEPFPMETGKTLALRSMPVSEANRYWGNILKISSTYGLENMTFYPSRLQLDSVENKVAIDAPLQAPQFGTDGRITTLADVQKANFNPDDGTYSLATGWGVNVFGFFTNGENVQLFSRQMALDALNGYVASTRAELRDDLVGLMDEHGDDMIRMLLELTFAADPQLALFGVTTMSQDSSDAIVRIVDGLYAINEGSLNCLRAAFLANCILDTANFPNTDEGNTALGALFARYSSLSASTLASKANEYGYTEIEDGVRAYNEVGNKLTNAIGAINRGEIPAAATFLFDVSTTSLGGFTSVNITNGIKAMAFDPNHTTNMETWISGSMIAAFPGLAAILGDYGVSMQDDNVDFENFKNPTLYADTTTTYDIPAEFGGGQGTYQQIFDGILVANCAGAYTINMTNTLGSQGSYDPSTNLGVLATSLAQTVDQTVEGDMIIVNQVSIGGSGYGYSLDLAFRCSEAGALMLQQVGADRTSGYTQQQVTEGTGYGSIFGGGSTMSFTASEDVTDPAALMEGLYVVFYDTQTGTIYAMAALDPTTVERDGQQVTGYLQLYTPAISDGILTKGSPTETIRNLEANQTCYITALVYLNGDVVNTAMFSSTEDVSLDGSLNLQFCTDAGLTPMQYNDYVMSIYG